MRSPGIRLETPCQIVRGAGTLPKASRWPSASMLSRRPAVPKNQTEHPPQSTETGWTHVLVEVDDDLRVARGPQPMAPGEKFPSNLLMVVDLPVEDHFAAPVLVGPR